MKTGLAHLDGISLDLNGAPSQPGLLLLSTLYLSRIPTSPKWLNLALKPYLTQTKCKNKHFSAKHVLCHIKTGRKETKLRRANQYVFKLLISFIITSPSWHNCLTYSVKFWENQKNFKNIFSFSQWAEWVTQLYQEVPYMPNFCFVVNIGLTTVFHYGSMWP